MGFGLKRSDLRTNAESKLASAKILYASGQFSDAYYLAGYAIEMALKACIAAQISAETIPDKAIIKQILNHQFPTLIGLAGLAEALRTHQDEDQQFAANWGVVCEWEPDIRYEPVDPTSAQGLIEAIIQEPSGVLPWIKAHW